MPDANIMAIMRNRASSTVAGFTHAGVTLTPEPGLGVGKVQFLAGITAEFDKAVFGRRAPVAGYSVASGKFAVSWLAPDEWLLTGPEKHVLAALARAESVGDSCLATDLSHARAAFRLLGEEARNRLAAVTPLDVSDSRMPIGGVARAPLGDTGMFLARLADIGGQACFRIIVDQTMATYAVRMLGGVASGSGAVL